MECAVAGAEGKAYLATWGCYYGRYGLLAVESRVESRQDDVRFSTGYTMGCLKSIMKYLWAFPTTCVGLLFLPLAGSGGLQWVDGVLEMHSRAIAFFLRRCTLLEDGASAMTLGHVVIGVDQHALDMTRAHERVHVRQCERWGPFFIPAYLLCSIYLLMRGKKAYLDNPFEVEARVDDGGNSRGLR
ncbi:MAG TPA: hypothetical protein VG722_07525 [Tepidisphaeraceae bacterium]|nr:hypothetical protein [Tepidisphaeraceae bacterium]